MNKVLHSCCLAALFLYAAQAAFGQTGTVAGTIFDANTGQPVRQATVTVQETGDSTVTELDGSYQFKLPAGTYTLAINADKYLSTTLEGLVVNQGEVTDGSTVLVSASAVTEVEVTATLEASQATAESVVMERKLAPTVSDAISAEEISQSTASDAAGALEKVTGVSVVGEGFVYVRGLGERYSATMLNNALITTTEPEKRVVPLDLFPSSLIDTLKVVKTYSADLPGEFSGGLVQMKTVEFPQERILRFSASTGFNTQTTGDSFQTYPGGDRDFFGFDDGTRSLPGSIPEEERLFRGAFPDEELAEFGRAFNPSWEVGTLDSARPEQSYSILAGNTFGKLGLIGAVAFGNNLAGYPEIFRAFNVGRPGEQATFTNFEDFRAHNEKARVGGIFNVAYRFSPKHRVSVRNTLTHDSEKEGRIFSGRNGSKGLDVFSERLRWIERSIIATQIEAEHSTGVWSSIFTWQLGISRATRDEPDLREVIRTPRADGSLEFLADPDSANRFFATLDDTVHEPAGKWSIPFFKGPAVGSFEIGFRATFRDRDFSSRRFRFLPAPGADLDLGLPSNQLLSRDNIDARNGFQLREITRGTDSYTAEMTVYAGYFNFDVALGQKWRVIAGLRVEDSEQDVLTVDPGIPNAIPVATSLVNRDPLPGINLVYSLTPKQNLRFAFGETLSRPDFRELSPFDFTDIGGGFTTSGNPDLVQTSIRNFDARWEWFLGGDQLIAASYFFKDFTDPIELVLSPGVTQRRTWLNAEGATNQGVELEFRRDLGAFTPVLSDFAIATNFTIVDSEVTIPEDTATPLTNFQRPLIGQSKYLLNLGFEWVRPQWRSSARFFMHRFTRRISEVGSFGLEDVFEEGRAMLDFVYEYQLREAGDWKIRFEGENLSDEEFLWTQGGQTKRLYSPGRTFSVGLSFSLLY